MFEQQLLNILPQRYHICMVKDLERGVVFKTSTLLLKTVQKDYINVVLILNLRKNYVDEINLSDGDRL